MVKNQLILLACIAAAIIATVTALPTPEEVQKKIEYEIVPIIRSEVNKHEDGSYDLQYESGDGSSRQEQGSFVAGGTDEEALEIKGSYKYINTDGEEVEVFYTAGKNGFVPYGSIINAEISAVAEAAKDLPKQEEEEPKKKSAGF